MAGAKVEDGGSSKETKLDRKSNLTLCFRPDLRHGELSTTAYAQRHLPQLDPRQFPQAGDAQLTPFRILALLYSRALRFRLQPICTDKAGRRQQLDSSAVQRTPTESSQESSRRTRLACERPPDHSRRRETRQEDQDARRIAPYPQNGRTERIGAGEKRAVYREKGCCVQGEGVGEAKVKEDRGIAGRSGWNGSQGVSLEKGQSDDLSLCDAADVCRYKQGRQEEKKKGRTALPF